MNQLARTIQEMHGNLLRDSEMAERLGVSTQKVKAVRSSLGLKPHIIYNGRLVANYVPPSEGRYRARQLMTDEQIAELYAGRRYA